MNHNGGAALVHQLQAEGVTTIFGIPGAQIMGLYDSLYDASGVRVITTRHEQGAAYMADGFSRTSGRPGVLTTVPGPGVYNTCAALATAYACCSPVLLLAGQVSRPLIGKLTGALHEVHDQLEIVRPVTKWAHRAIEPDDLAPAVHDAFRHMLSGAGRPTHLEFPPEALAEPAGVPTIDPWVRAPARPDPDAVTAAAALLAEASAPVIVAGGGVVVGDACRELTELAERLQALVLVTREGKAAIDNRHPLFVGSLWANARRLRPVLEAADVIVAVGTRLQGISAAKGQRLIRIDVDPDQAASGLPDVSMTADAQAGLAALVAEIPGGRGSRADEAAVARTTLEERLSAFGHQYELVRAMRAALPDDTVLVAGTTTVGYMAHALFPTHTPRSYLGTSYMGTLGFATPMGIGAQLGAPTRPVVTISGDGGFLFAATELATAVQYGVPTVNIVFNDSAYGNPNREQREEWGNREIGTELVNPDFVAMAESFGCAAMRADTPDALGGALREAVADGRTVVIEYRHERMPYVLRDPDEPAPVRRPGEERS